MRKAVPGVHARKTFWEGRKKPACDGGGGPCGKEGPPPVRARPRSRGEVRGDSWRGRAEALLPIGAGAGMVISRSSWSCGSPLPSRSSAPPVFDASDATFDGFAAQADEVAPEEPHALNSGSSVRDSAARP